VHCSCSRCPATGNSDEKTAPQVDRPDYRVSCSHTPPASQRRVSDARLTPDEVEVLMAAVKANRDGHRDRTMVLITYRHGLRATELVDPRWTQVDLDNARLHVRRVKTASRPSIR
jgi:integrase